MRRLLLAVAVALLALLLAWMFLRREHIAPAVAPPSSPNSAFAAPLGDVEGWNAQPVRSSAIDAQSIVDASAPASATNDCHVLGRVVDEQGAPIEAAAVTLTTVGHWSDDTDPPSIELEGRTWKAFKVASAKDGRFRFEVPVPTAESVRLTVYPDAFHAFGWRDFGTIRGEVVAPLVRGDNDVGDIVVAATGAIRGHVTDPEGKPIAVTKLSFSGTANYAHPITDADGAYEVGHVKTGTPTFEVDAVGWMTAKHEQVLIRAGLTTEGVDFRLEHAPSISGIVVDKDGAPLADVGIDARPVEDGFMTSARSDTHGAFSLSLKSAQTHQLIVRAQPRVEDWSGTFESGRQDLRIVLDAIPLTTFHIVEAVGSAPIERFGIRVETEPAHKGTTSFVDPWPAPPQIESHPGGEVILPAVPVRSTIEVVADGHAAKQVTVAWERRDHAEQTIALERESTLSARVLFAGTAVAGAKVALEAERLRKGQPVDDWNGSPDVDDFAGRRRFQVTDKEGAFRFTRLAVGTYRMTIDTPLAARSTQRGLHVDAGTPRDLGTIVLDPGATLRVHILLPAGERPEWSAFIGKYPDLRRAELQADGTLVFQGLEAGTHEVTIPPHAPWLIEPMKQKVTIVAGETRDIDIDLVPHDPCNVTVHVTQNGDAVGWIHVRCQIMSNGFAIKTIDVGTTSDDGVASGKCPGGTTVRFVATTAKDVPLGSSSVVTLPPSGSFEENLALSTGDVSVQLPSSVILPPTGNVTLALTPATGGALISLDASTKSAPFRERTSFDWTATTVDFGGVVAGEYDALVEVHRFEKQSGTTENSWMRTDVRPPFKTHVVVGAGKPVTIAVP